MLSLLPALFLAEDLMHFVFERIEDPRYGSLFAALLIFLLPTIVMGMIAPYSIRLITKNKNSSGQTAGFLYFVSTLGSAIGTIMTSFYLVKWMEINQILWLIFFILLLAGMLALIIGFGDQKTLSVNH